VRDDFSEETKRVLAARVGNHCSNPGCNTLTSGPQENTSKALNLGVAAHITGAAIGGPRYDATLSPDARSHADNGIWLCQNCAKKVDNDTNQFPKAVLGAWKVMAEHQARTSVGKTAFSNVNIAGDLNLFIDSEKPKRESSAKSAVASLTQLNIDFQRVEKICVVDSGEIRHGLVESELEDPDGYGGVSVSFDNDPPTSRGWDVKGRVEFLLPNGKDAGHASCAVWLNHAGPYTTFNVLDTRKLLLLAVVEGESRLFNDMREDHSYIRSGHINPAWSQVKVTLVEERTGWGKAFLFSKSSCYPDCHDPNDLLVLVDTQFLE